jgi:coenzyme F420-reducing hydrogenase delta subunit/ferredoxin
MQGPVQHALARLEGLFDALFGQKANPLYHLGALSFFFFWIVAASGIYLYIFFETSIDGAYLSVEHLTREQWYLGGVMRSLHRYASDALAIVALLHLGREFVRGRYRGFRWYSWVSGVPLLWFLYASGINGYWLVWDRLAQYLAVATAEWLDYLPIFGGAIARNFLNEAAVSDRFFSLMQFLHIGIPLFMLFGMWVHIQRISRPRVNPPRTLVFGTFASLLLLSFLKPALSQGPADLDTVASVVGLDWFFMPGYPLIDRWSPGTVWLIAAGVTLLLTVLPWLPRRPRGERGEQPEPIAVVDPANCNGCGRCVADCPFNAVDLQPHPGRPGHKLAVVDGELCGSCGICAGACPSSTPFRSIEDLVTGIDMPPLTVHALRERTEAATAQLTGEACVVVYGCSRGADVQALAGPGVAAFRLICTGQLPPSFVDYVLRSGRVDGVLVTGCRAADCYYRLGNTWTERRFRHEREPHLRTRAARERVHVYWAGVADLKDLKRELAAYRERLRALPPLALAPMPVRKRRRTSHG